MRNAGDTAGPAAVNAGCWIRFRGRGYMMTLEMAWILFGGFSIVVVSCFVSQSHFPLSMLALLLCIADGLLQIFTNVFI